jgi:hypothetical protein
MKSDQEEYRVEKEKEGVKEENKNKEEKPQ